MSSNNKINPWLVIPHSDYEAHMSDPNVQQLQVLSNIFSDVLERYSPRSIAVLGCAGGNGFEHLVNRKIHRLVGIDLNPDYLSVCEDRFFSSIPILELICSDLNELELESEMFDLIHAALIFEYVDIETVLKKISDWLIPQGVLSIVLQMPSVNSPDVSETKYESLKLLREQIKLVESGGFHILLNKNNLLKIYSNITKLKSGKKFLVQCFQKKGSKAR